MAGIIHAAAQRINTSVAGVTGSAPEVPTPHATSPTELADLIPTEFGGLTHLFGGGGGTPEGATQYAPVNPGLERPAGSLAGRLGGLVPDVRAGAVHAVETAKAAAAPRPVSSRVDAAVATARRWLKV